MANLTESSRRAWRQWRQGWSWHGMARLWHQCSGQHHHYRQWDGRDAPRRRLPARPQQQCDERGMAPLLQSAPDTDAKRCDAEVWRCRWTSIERTAKETMEQS